MHLKIPTRRCIDIPNLLNRQHIGNSQYQGTGLFKKFSAYSISSNAVFADQPAEDDKGTGYLNGVSVANLASPTQLDPGGKPVK